MKRQRIAELLALGQYETLAGEVATELGVHIHDMQTFRQVCLHSGGDWHREPRMWLLQKLDELGCAFRPTVTDEENDQRRIRLVVRMHCFFLGIVETPEHQARLANVHLSPSEKKVEEQEEASRLARSQVFNTMQVVHPIDKVAIRVAPEVVVSEEDEAKVEAEDERKKRIARTRPREVVQLHQRVFSSSGEEGTVVEIRRCSTPDCPGVILVTRWADGEETDPCTAGMIFNGRDTWRIPDESVS